MLEAQEVKYEEFKIISQDGSNAVDIYSGKFRVISFNYYENILSPYITGNVVIVSTTDAAKSAEDTQQRTGSLYSFLPLSVGCIIIAKIKAGVGQQVKSLDFSTDSFKRLYVTDVTILDKNSTSETIILKFVSRIAWLNETTRVTKNYKGKITDSVQKILRETLTIDPKKISIDPSANSYSFSGMRKRPFDLLIMLAKQTVPASVSNPGYFCYETKTGFKYISADRLIKQQMYPIPYEYRGNVQSSFSLKDSSNNFKILSLTTNKDQSLLSQIRSGMYATKNIFFNPSNLQFTEIDISVVNDPKFSSLAKKPKLPGILASDFKRGKKYHRVQTAILDVGANEANLGINNSPELYYAAGVTRYNILFSQSHSVTVPCNLDLDAGNKIKLNIESTSSNKEQGIDERQSGEYIIKSLCHHFEPYKAVTSMNLIRDSYGLHFTKSN